MTEIKILSSTKSYYLPPLTFPCIRPIISRSPPDLACITILIRATDEIFTLLKWFGLELLINEFQYLTPLTMVSVP